jgi:two-component sensor histidine kinase
MFAGALLIWGAAILLQTIVLAEQEKVYLLYAFQGAAVYYGLLAILAVLPWKTCKRLEERPHSRWAAIGIHFILGTFILIVWQGAYLGCLYLWTGNLAEIRLETTGLWQALGAVTTYGMLVVGIIAVQTSRRLQIQLQRQSELQILARDAEIRALKAQIRPHFFFNVMNSIYSLIETRPREAQEMVELVANLMRQTLDAAEEDLVSLEWELDAVRTYLRIEKIRFGDRLQIRVESDGAPLDSLVPPLFLQPLVENAVKHGIAPVAGPGEVDVLIKTDQHELEFTIRDSGPGIRESAGAEEREGRGLSITMRRLENLYGKKFSVARRQLEPRGFEVCIRIPLQKLDSSATIAHA